MFNRISDINCGYKEFERTEGAFLIDVRTPMEFAESSIPGAFNIPLDEISDTLGLVPSLDTPVFLYCKSGNRSRMAAEALINEGFTRVFDIGGIKDYKGDIER